MSKASAWATKYAKTAIPTYSIGDIAVGQVSVRPDTKTAVLSLSHVSLDPAAALALARWILDTFGEAK